MEIITSLENKKIKYLNKLNQKKYRDSENLFLAPLEHLVIEALKNNCLVEVLCTEDYEKKYPVKTTIVTYDILKKLSNTITPQKVLGICRKPNKNKIGNKILILDDIQDPGNLGTIIRSSVAFNIDTICLSEKTVDLYNEKVLRSTEGMLFQINIIKKDIQKFILELKKDNYEIYGTKVDNGTDIKDFTPSIKYALIVGNEGNGVNKEILSLCDKYLYITSSSKCESLNVGVATSIILYEFNK